MRWIILLLSLTLGACAGMDSRECANPASFADSVLKLDDAQGTSFLTGEREMLTVMHVTVALQMSESWQRIRISQRKVGPGEEWYGANPLMRIKRIYSVGLPEELHLVEMRDPFFWKPPALKLRETPLSLGERVSGVGYSAGKQRFGSGRFVDRAPSIMQLRGFGGFAISNDKEEYPLASGASGGPIADCDGRVVGAISKGWFDSERPADAPNIGGVLTHSIAREFAR